MAGTVVRIFAAHRIFLGSQNRTAVLQIRDQAGRPPIRLCVDSADTARLEFLDANGQVVRTLPE